MTRPLETIARGDRSRIVQPRQVIARTEVEWRAVWAAHAGPDAPPPAVDFESRMVAAVFAGERPAAGHDISIVSSRRDGVVLLLMMEERQPETGAVAAQIVSSPFHIVTLPRYEGEVTFLDVNDRRAAYGSSLPRSSGRRHEPAPSSTGLPPHVAGALAYLAGPFSGALLLLIESTSRFVKFHAWQALLVLGAVGAAALIFLGAAFLLLVVSPMAFWTMLWLSVMTAGVWLIIWLLCIVQAFHGRVWRLPLAGGYAERRAGLAR